MQPSLLLSWDEMYLLTGKESLYLPPKKNSFRQSTKWAAYFEINRACSEQKFREKSSSPRSGQKKSLRPHHLNWIFAFHPPLPSLSLNGLIEMSCGQRRKKRGFRGKSFYGKRRQLGVGAGARNKSQRGRALNSKSCCCAAEGREKK